MIKIFIWVGKIKRIFPNTFEIIMIIGFFWCEISPYNNSACNCELTWLYWSNVILIEVSTYDITLKEIFTKKKVYEVFSRTSSSTVFRYLFYITSLYTHYLLYSRWRNFINLLLHVHSNFLEEKYIAKIHHFPNINIFSIFIA